MMVRCPNRDKCQSSVCHHRETHEKTADCTPGLQEITCDGKIVNVMVACRAFPDSACVDSLKDDLIALIYQWPLDYDPFGPSTADYADEILKLLSDRGIYDYDPPDSESPADLEPDSVPSNGDCGQVPEMESE